MTVEHMTHCENVEMSHQRNTLYHHIVYTHMRDVQRCILWSTSEGNTYLSGPRHCSVHGAESQQLEDHTTRALGVNYPHLM